MISSKSVNVSILLAILSACNVVTAFVPSTSLSQVVTRHSQGNNQNGLSMAPKFDKSTQRWIPTTDDEENGGYGPFGTLMRFGPKPVVTRFTNPDEYEQGVLKMMAQKGYDRQEAQGNFDAYLENPNDWAFQKIEEEKGGFKREYGKAPSTKQLALNGVWTCVVIWFFNDLISGVASGRYQFEPLFKFW
mmetsp:Transcript_27875/g.34411  ORF Transcript_27875/g.34411 Transcript_27875/m.34411 type:complete len:189 (-) Transcript_27875:252-818(-)